MKRKNMRAKGLGLATIPSPSIEQRRFFDPNQEAKIQIKESVSSNWMLAWAILDQNSNFLLKFNKPN